MATDAGQTAEPPVKAKRRWLQFSLRTLMVLMLVLGCGFGWFARKLQQARMQREAVAAIKCTVLSRLHFMDAESPIVVQREVLREEKSLLPRVDAYQTKKQSDCSHLAP